jgi:TonB family protein
MNRMSLIFLVCCALLKTPFTADQELDRILNDRYHDKILALREPLQSDSQEYDSDGHLLTNAHMGTWTMYGRMVVNKVVVEPGKLRLEGKRVYYMYDESKKKLAPFPTGEKLRITIRLIKPLTAAEEAAESLARVFAMTPEIVVSTAPAAWQKYLAKELAPQGAESVESAEIDEKQSQPIDTAASAQKPASGAVEKTFRLGEPGVTPPRVLSRPDPEFTEAARQLRLQGIVGLNATVDSAGRVTNVSIVKPLGAGMDEAAVDGVSAWRLAPATKDGEPVAVAIYIEVDFRSTFGKAH